jgi:cytochrome oxidase Cu insertion factor (SCO1/SenC/PrrC family)
MRHGRTALAALALATAPLAVACDAAAQGASPEIGAPAPEFTLTDTYGNEHALADFRGDWVVLEWLNYGCPYVGKHYNSGNMQALQRTYGEKGVKWLAIVSSAPGKQGYYEPAAMNEQNEKHDQSALAVLLDPTGKVGRLYNAQTTPQMVLIDPEGTLLYNGAIDDKPSSRASSLEGAHNYIAAALDEAMAGKPVSVATTKPYGCSVKYPG